MNCMTMQGLQQSDGCSKLRHPVTMVTLLRYMNCMAMQGLQQNDVLQ
jgi:hypothetical protein